MSGAKRTGSKFAMPTGDDKHSEMKIAPRQRRARVTIESILDATSNLLVEQGVENLSTNMICDRAGLTPPALYRYFPNKYAVLKELAVRLKNHQHEIFKEWLVQGGTALIKTDNKLNRDAVVSSIYEIQSAIYSATKDNPANLWIGRIIRTQPAMAELHAESRAHAWELLQQHLGNQSFNAPFDTVFNAARVALDLVYSSIELAVEDESLDPDLVFNSVAHMIGAEYMRLVDPRMADPKMADPKMAAPKPASDGASA